MPIGTSVIFEASEVGMEDATTSEVTGDEDAVEVDESVLVVVGLGVEEVMQAETNISTPARTAHLLAIFTACPSLIGPMALGLGAANLVSQGKFGNKGGR